MKVKQLLFAVLAILMWVPSVQAQNESEEEKYFLEFSTDTRLQVYDYIKKQSVESYLIALKGTRFYVVDTLRYPEQNDKVVYIIKLWKFEPEKGMMKENPDATPNKEYELNGVRKRITKEGDRQRDTTQKVKVWYPTDTDNPFYFTIDEEDYKSKVNRKFLRNIEFSAGLTVIPFKVRFGDGGVRFFEFTKSFTVGSTFGMRVRISRNNPNYFHLVGLLGLSSVHVDSATTSGTINRDVNVAALTVGVGAMFEFGKVSVGLFSGMDYLSGDIGRNWLYTNSPFIGAGIGLQVFGKANNSKNTRVRERN